MAATPGLQRVGSVLLRAAAAAGPCSSPNTGAACWNRLRAASAPACSHLAFSTKPDKGEDSGDDDASAPQPAPSTSGRAAAGSPPSTTPLRMGWMGGPAANLPNKTRLIEDEWEEVRDPRTGDVAWRSVLTGACGGVSVWEGGSTPKAEGRAMLQLQKQLHAPKCHARCIARLPLS